MFVALTFPNLRVIKKSSDKIFKNYLFFKLFFRRTDASAHGYITSPESRVLVCYENNVEGSALPACITAKAAANIGFYSPQSIAIGGVKDNHQQVFPDKKLCSTGVSGYEGLVIVRNDWPATRVQLGLQEFVWTNTA